MADSTAVQKTETQQKVLAFTKMVNTNFAQAQLRNIFGKNAGTFATSLIEMYTSSKDLQECDPKLVYAEAMKAAALHLPIGGTLGRSYVLAFRDHGIKKPVFIIGWKGLVDLAQRSGFYRTINADVVYEGQLVGKDLMSGFIDLSGEKESDNIIGFFGYFELINGFKKCVYMDAHEMIQYALHYSPSLRTSKLTPEQFLQLMQKTAANGPSGIGWTGDPISMAKKTCLRQVLKYGPMSIEMSRALAEDTDEPMSAASERDAAQSAPKPVIDAEAVPVEDAKSEEPDLGKLDD